MNGCRSLFAAAGQRLRIHVGRLDDAQWARLLRFLERGGLQAVVPPPSGPIARMKQAASPLVGETNRRLALRFGAVGVSGATGPDGRFVLEIDTAAITTPAQARVIYRLVTTLARLLGRRIVASGERDVPLFEYTPGHGLHHHSAQH